MGGGWGECRGRRTKWDEGYYDVCRQEWCGSAALVEGEPRLNSGNIHDGWPKEQVTALEDVGPQDNQRRSKDDSSRSDSCQEH